jgi:outer membrane receptor protein involved in Fe transport
LLWAPPSGTERKVSAPRLIAQEARHRGSRHGSQPLPIPFTSGLCLLAFVALLGGLPVQAESAPGAPPDVASSDSTSTSSQSPPPAHPQAPAGASQAVEEIVVTAARLNLIGTASTASQGIVNDDELTLTPAYRPGQVLETVPGLDVTVHSGEGKANQYLMRGYNLDHGTDLALFVDGMPVNEPTHAHGDGYADINFMIPELATGVTYTKGPYYAFEGDFASVGAIHVNYLDKIPDQVSLGVGTMDFQRAFTAGSTPLGNGTLLAAGEVQHYDGPWDTPGDQRKVNSVLRYSSGSDQQGYAVTAMLYHDLWNAQTDQPERALAEGLINRYGELDPSDGGQAQRESLSMNVHDEIGGGKLLASAYVIGNHLILWNDFTHYLIDPLNADQEQQREDRTTVGSDLSYTHNYAWLGANTELVEGLHVRYDFNEVSRVPTQDRIPLTPVQLAAVDYPSAFTEKDRVQLGALAGYVQATTHWSEWFRSVIGFRADYIYGSDTGTYPGDASSALPEPKASLIFTPRDTTEFYLSYGRGYHTDDLRGVNQARLQGVYGAPLIASQSGEELGVRQQLLGGKIAATLALFNLNAQSETTYNPDIGQDTAGPGSTRRGFELNITYQALRWLEFYGSYSGDRARYTSPLDDGTGHLGYYLPNAPFATGSFNVYIRNLGPWSGGLAYRYLGAYPLSSGPCNDSAVAADFPGLSSCALAPTRQGQVFGSGYGEWNADLHYAFAHGWTAGLGIYNLLNNHSNAMEYWYVDRLPGEPVVGAADIHFHPLEPISARLSVGKIF